MWKNQAAKQIEEQRKIEAEGERQVTFPPVVSASEGSRKIRIEKGEIVLTEASFNFSIVKFPLDFVEEVIAAYKEVGGK